MNWIFFSISPAVQAVYPPTTALTWTKDQPKRSSISWFGQLDMLAAIVSHSYSTTFYFTFASSSWCWNCNFDCRKPSIRCLTLDLKVMTLSGIWKWHTEPTANSFFAALLQWICFNPAWWIRLPDDSMYDISLPDHLCLTLQPWWRVLSDPFEPSKPKLGLAP